MGEISQYLVSILYLLAESQFCETGAEHHCEEHRRKYVSD